MNAVPRLHALFAAFPIALLTASVGLEIVSWKWEKFRETGYCVLFLGLLGAVLAVASGFLAASVTNAVELAPAGVARHRGFAAGAVITFALMIAFRLATRNKFTTWTRIFYISVGIVGVVHVIVAAWLGTSLVFDHGIGVSR